MLRIVMADGRIVAAEQQLQRLYFCPPLFDCRSPNYRTIFLPAKVNLCLVVRLASFLITRLNFSHEE